MHKLWIYWAIGFFKSAADLSERNILFWTVSVLPVSWLMLSLINKLFAVQINILTAVFVMADMTRDGRIIRSAEYRGCQRGWRPEWIAHSDIWIRAEIGIWPTQTCWVLHTEFMYTVQSTWQSCLVFFIMKHPEDSFRFSDSLYLLCMPPITPFNISYTIIFLSPCRPTLRLQTLPSKCQLVLRIDGYRGIHLRRSITIPPNRRSILTVLGFCMWEDKVCNRFFVWLKASVVFWLLVCWNSEVFVVTRANEFRMRWSLMRFACEMPE